MPSSLSSSEPERALLITPGFDGLSQCVFILFCPSTQGSSSISPEKQIIFNACNWYPSSGHIYNSSSLSSLDLFRPVHTLEGISSLPSWSSPHQAGLSFPSPPILRLRAPQVFPSCTTRAWFPQASSCIQSRYITRIKSAH